MSPHRKNPLLDLNSLSFSPVVLPDLCRWVAAGRADFLLDVEGHLAAATAQGVRLVATLSERAGSLRLEKELQDNFETLKSRWGPWKRHGQTNKDHCRALARFSNGIESLLMQINQIFYGILCLSSPFCFKIEAEKEVEGC